MHYGEGNEEDGIRINYKYEVNDKVFLRPTPISESLAYRCMIVIVEIIPYYVLWKSWN